jgi:hypothetical protein
MANSFHLKKKEKKISVEHTLQSVYTLIARNITRTLHTQKNMIDPMQKRPQNTRPLPEIHGSMSLGSYSFYKAITVKSNNFIGGTMNLQLNK